MKKKLSTILFTFSLILIAIQTKAQLSQDSDQHFFSKKYSTYLNPHLYFLGIAPAIFSETPPSNSRSGPYVPKAYRYNELGFFCKMEVKMEKNAKLPIKVRLGDVDYVDWLEGKRTRY